MSDLINSIDLSSFSDTSDAYWVELEQEIPETRATLEEAVELVDALFDVEPCIPTPEEPEEKAPVDLDAKRAEMLAKLAVMADDAGLCSDDGIFTAYVRIKRSHQNKPYNLLIQGGEITQTTTGHIEEVNRVLMVEDASSFAINLPADQEITVSWQGVCYSSIGRLSVNPELHVFGDRIAWDGNVSGALQVSYDQPYDLATIETEGEDCNVTCLYYLSVDEITLEPPAEDTDDTEAEIVCKKIGGTVVPNPEGDCYIVHVHRELCNCSGALANSYSVLVPVSCPDDVAKGTTIGNEDTSSYVTCDEEDRVHDPDFYEDVCCDPPPFGLPRCTTTYSNWGGKGVSQEQLEGYRRMFDGRVIVVGVGPKDTPCGTLTTKQDINPIDCCIDVTEIEINIAGTDWEIGLPGAATLKATGGEAPYYWETSGGYLFANGLGEDVTTRPENTIYTNDQKVCGDATTNLHDDCSSVSFLTEQTAGDLEPELPENIVVSPDTMTLVELTEPSVGPYQWGSGGDLEWMVPETDGPRNILISSPFFCGSEEISVTDVCGNSDNVKVRSTDGVWVEQFGFDICSPPGTPYPPGKIKGEYKVRVAGTFSLFKLFCDTSSLPCPIGNTIVDDDAMQTSCEAGHIECVDDLAYSGGCCTCQNIFGDTIYRAQTTYATQLWKWECVP